MLVNDVWELVTSVKGDEWDPLDESSPWTTTLTGATTVRDTLIVSNVGLSLPIKMYQTIEAMGGFEVFKEIVAVDLQTFVLRDSQDRLWNIDNQQLLTVEELSIVTKTYEEIFTANNNPEVAAQMAEEWEEFLAEDETEGADPEGVEPEPVLTNIKSFSGTSQSIREFASAEGTLDLKKVKSYVEGQNAARRSGSLKAHEGQANLVYPDKDINCFLFWCQQLRTGTLPLANNVQRGAYAQSGKEFSRNGQSFDFVY
ncbi:MAG: hypothetical protein ACRCYY_21550 [Trueperaceae bacterium]